ncbi:hypothetical protein ACFL13_01115 [Patescibacteria group bacterium]
MTKIFDYEINIEYPEGWCFHLPSDKILRFSNAETYSSMEVYFSCGGGTLRIGTRGKLVTIYVDGKFIGNTRTIVRDDATVKLTSDFKIEVKNP